MNKYKIIPPTTQLVTISLIIEDGDLQGKIIDVKNITFEDDEEDDGSFNVDYALRGKTELTEEQIEDIVCPIFVDIVTNAVKNVMNKGKQNE